LFDDAWNFLVPVICGHSPVTGNADMVSH